MSAKYYIQGVKKIGNEWRTCDERGLGVGAIFSRNTIGRELKGILSDMPIDYKLGGGLNRCEGSSLTIMLDNRGGSNSENFGSIAGDLPFQIFLTNPDNYLLQLTVSVPRKEVKGYSDEFVILGDEIIVWRGFLVNSRYTDGGNFVELEFTDLAYWLGNIQTGKNFAHVEIEQLLKYLVGRVPFIFSTSPLPPSPTLLDYGIDIDLRGLPECYHFKKVCRINDSLYRSFDFADPIEIVRGDNGSVYVRAGEKVAQVILATGTVVPPISSPYYSPDPDYDYVEWLYDPAQYRRNMPTGIGPLYPPPKYRQTNPIYRPVGVPAQAFCWRNSRVYCAVIQDETSGSSILIFSLKWDFLTGTYHSRIDTVLLSFPDQVLSDVDLNLVIDDNEICAFVILQHDEIGKTWIYRVDGDTLVSIGEHFIYKTGRIVQYLKGAAYRMLGVNVDKSDYKLSEYRLSRIELFGTLVSTQAMITDAGKEILNTLPAFCCFRVHNERYRNCIGFVKREDDANYLTIVNSRFEIVEVLYPGLRPPRQGLAPYPMVAGESARSMTLSGQYYLPTMLGVCPQDTSTISGVNYEGSLNIFAFRKAIPTTIDRLDSYNDSVAKTLTDFTTAYSAFWWMLPDYILRIRGLSSEGLAGDVNLINEVMLGGQEDVEAWGENYDCLKCEYGKDQELKYGTEKWNNRVGQLSLKDKIYSSDQARMLALQHWILYKPLRQQLTAVLKTGLFWGLWRCFDLHKRWVSTAVRVEQDNLRTTLEGITPLQFDAFLVIEKLREWLMEFDERQGMWFYIGQLPQNPGDPWYGVFIGDRLGYPPAVNQLLRELMNDIRTAINADAISGAYRGSDIFEWWVMPCPRFGGLTPEEYFMPRIIEILLLLC